MSTIILKFLLCYISLGVLAFICLWIKTHTEKNKEKFEEYISELSEDTGLDDKDCMVIVYAVALAFGFIILPIYLVRKVIKTFSRG